MAYIGLYTSPQVAKGISLFILSRHLRWFGTKALHRRIVELYPTANVQRLKDIADILHERSVLIFNEKKAALQAGDDALKHQIGEGRDVMSVLREFFLWAAITLPRYLIMYRYLTVSITHSTTEYDGIGGG